MGSPTGHSNHWAFLNSLGIITEELSLQMTRHSSTLPIVGYSFSHEWGEEMHVKSLSQGLSVDLVELGLEPGTSGPEANCLPLDHND